MIFVTLFVSRYDPGQSLAWGPRFKFRLSNLKFPPHYKVATCDMALFQCHVTQGQETDFSPLQCTSQLHPIKKYCFNWMLNKLIMFLPLAKLNEKCSWLLTVMQIEHLCSCCTNENVCWSVFTNTHLIVNIINVYWHCCGVL